MTIEQLLKCKVSELESMSDQQILDIFQPYLSVIRRKVEKEDKPVKVTKTNAAFKHLPIASRTQALLALAKSKGINI